MKIDFHARVRPGAEHDPTFLGVHRKVQHVDGTDAGYDGGVQIDDRPIMQHDRPVFPAARHHRFGGTIGGGNGNIFFLITDLKYYILKYICKINECFGKIA